MDTMGAMNTNMTNVINYMAQGISDMADNILDTECLILNMSQQIGTMANRILEFEQNMADNAAACCVGLIVPPIPGAGLLAMRSQTPAPDCKAWDGPHQRDVFPPIPRETVPIPSPVEFHFSFFNPFAIAMSAMAVSMNSMIDFMAHMSSEVAGSMTAGADEIQNMAQVIIELEHSIIDMGMRIGSATHCIVSIGETGLAFTTWACDHSKEPSFPSSVCEPISDDGFGPYCPKSGCPPGYPLGPHPQIAHRSPPEALGGFFGDFSELVDAAAHTATAMRQITADQVGVVKIVMQGIADMIQRIIRTIGLIVDMGNQILDMIGRMKDTANLLAELGSKCTPSVV